MTAPFPSIEELRAAIAAAHSRRQRHRRHYLNDCHAFIRGHRRETRNPPEVTW